MYVYVHVHVCVLFTRTVTYMIRHAREIEAQIPHPVLARLHPLVEQSRLRGFTICLDGLAEQVRCQEARTPTHI